MVESNGIHANGLTLARKIADDLPLGYLTQIPGGKMYGDDLLRPTYIYVDLVRDCLDYGIDLHYAVNVTGHGWRKLMRAEGSFSYVIDCLPPKQEIFEFIQKHGNITDEEAYATFNMGAGFALFAPESDCDSIINIALECGRMAFRAGTIYKTTEEKRVVIEPKGITYYGSSMNIR